MVLIGSHDTNNLVDFKYQPHWKGERGEHGQGADCNGKEGVPAILKLPLGTVIINLETELPVAEIIEDGQQIVLLKGGNGGWGNTHFRPPPIALPSGPIPANWAKSARFG